VPADKPSCLAVEAIEEGREKPDAHFLVLLQPTQPTKGEFNDLPKPKPDTEPSLPNLVGERRQTVTGFVLKQSMSRLCPQADQPEWRN
jgi:hypothetical protein